MVQLVAPLSTVDTIAQYTLGSRTMDKSGNEYIYLTGVASTIVGSWVTFDELYITALLVSGAKGPLAVSMGINVASRYGWYQIYGSAEACVITTTAADSIVGFETTSGYVGDGKAAADTIYGAICRDSSAAGTGVYTVQLYYPMVANGAVA